MLKIILRQSWLWYLVCSIIVFSKFKLEGKFVLQTAPDSDSYLYADFSSLVAALSGIRTFGYPLFLKGVALFSPEFLLLPDIQFIIYSLAIFVFFIGLRIYGFSGFQALVTACPLLGAEIIRQYAAWMLTESLAVSLAISTIGLLLMVISKTRNFFYWIALAVSLFLTYQVRPAFLFLILLTPCLGLILFLVRNKNWMGKKIDKSIVIKLIAVSMIPFLAFSTLRLMMVNHFGLVSFGGYNIVGITTSMLTDELIPDLAVEQQPLARAIMEKRRLHRKLMKTDEGAEIKPGTSKVPKYCTQPLATENPINYEAWSECYAYNIWRLSVPVATEINGLAKEAVINEQLTMLSTAIIKKRPFLYFYWIYKSFITTIIHLAEAEILTIKLAKLLLIYILVNLLVSIIYIVRRGKFNNSYQLKESPGLFMLLLIANALAMIQKLLGASSDSFIISFASFTLIASSVNAIINTAIILFFRKSKTTFWETFRLQLPDKLYVIIVIGMTVFLSGLALVVLVEPPDFRYVNAVSVFLPSILSLMLLISISSVFNKIRRLQLFR